MKQPTQPLQELPENASLADVITRLNEVIRIINGMWFTDDTYHNE
jgi:hypothetical protein